MKKFIFQLETFLKISRMEREKAEVALFAVKKKLYEQEQQLILLNKELDDGLLEYEETLQQGTVNVNVLKIYGDFFSWQRYQIDKQKEDIGKTKAEEKQCLETLLKYEKKVKSVEEIRQKRFDEYKLEALAEEQKEIDEIGLQMHIRKALTEDL